MQCSGDEHNKNDLFLVKRNQQINVANVCDFGPLLSYKWREGPIPRRGVMGPWPREGPKVTLSVLFSSFVN